jgi:glycosyltransferase involved in cell wall biosynthesis
MRQPAVVFGINSVFAARNLLPETLAMVRERGWSAVLIAPGKDAELRAVADSEFECRGVEIEREIAPLRDLAALWRMYRILRTVRPAVTNMSTPKVGFLGGLAGWAAGVPHRIYTLRGLRYETARSWKRAVLLACERVACGCAHQVICISRSVRENAVRDGILPRAKAVLLGERVSEGISRKRLEAVRAASGEEVRAALGIPPDAAVIGFVGRLTRDKGIGELIRAFGELLAEGRRVRLLLVGSFETGDPVDAELVEWVRNCREVHAPGFASNPAPYYRAIDVFAFPSYREGMAKSLLEAAAAGVPVIATSATGMGDVVMDGVTGLLVPPGDAGALVSALRKLLDDRELAARMGAAGSRMVEEQYQSTVYLARLGAMLESMATESAPPVKETREDSRSVH